MPDPGVGVRPHRPDREDLIALGWPWQYRLVRVIDITTLVGVLRSSKRYGFEPIG